MEARNLPGVHAPVSDVIDAARGKCQCARTDPDFAPLINTNNQPLTSRGIAILGTNFGDYAETTTCGSTVPANSSCEINVTFTPSATGTRRGSVYLRDDGGGGAQRVKLTGNGVSN